MQIMCRFKSCFKMFILQCFERVFNFRLQFLHIAIVDSLFKHMNKMYTIFNRICFPRVPKSVPVQ